jgi:hypothetical protein
VQLQFERSALQTRYGSVRLRSTSPRSRCRTALRLLSASGQVRILPGAPRRVRLLARSRGSQPRRARSILARGATSLPAESGGLATNEARGGSTPSRDTRPSPRERAAMLRTSRDAVRLRARALRSFWDRLTVGRELLALEIVVRVHGPEPRRASTAGDVRGFTRHVRRVRSPGSVRTATWVTWPGLISPRSKARLLGGALFAR